MVVVHATIGSLLLFLSLAAGLWGAWCWRSQPSARSFWLLLRLAQGAAVVQAAWGGTLLALGHHPAHLHVLYGVLPVVVSFIAEQLRLASAQTVLATYGLESTAEVRALEEGKQNALAVAIMKREVGIMAVSALVVFALALRAAQSAGLF